MKIDINCDMGEGMPHDAAIMPFISSVNIACGYHAGDAASIRDTIKLALLHGVHIGAHVSFPDRENFGRSEMQLPPGNIAACIKDQLELISKIAVEAGTVLTHVKPHGALYNMSAKDPQLAHTIASAIKSFNPGLVLFGLSGSHSIEEGKALGLKVAAETFADRTYQDDGSLTPRTQHGALIHDTKQAVAQVLQMIAHQKVKSINGNMIPVVADTICIHGDGPNALLIAKAIHSAMEKQNIHLEKINSNRH